MTIYLPAAIYGKDLKGKNFLAQSYKWLAVNPNFPENAKNLANFWFQKFQWKSDSKNQWIQPVALWVPLDDKINGALLIRFINAGHDDKGRPNTLKAEAAYAHKEILTQYPDLPFLFFEQGSKLTSNILDADKPNFKLNQSLVQIELDKISYSSINIIDRHCLACDNLKNFSLQHIDKMLIFDTRTWNFIKKTVIKNNEKISNSAKSSDNSIDNDKGKNFMNKKPFFTKCITLTLSLIILTSIFGGWVWNLKMDRKELNIQLHELKNKLHTKNQTLTKVKSEMNSLQHKFDEKIKKERQEKNILKDQLSKKEREISIMQKDLDEVTRQKIYRLNEIENYLHLLKPFFKALTDTFSLDSFNAKEMFHIFYDTKLDY